MFRKNYFTLLFAVALLIASSSAVFAQTAPVVGRVSLKKADGTVVPLPDATIDVYRTDVKGKLPSGKTNSKGEFTFAGFPVGGIYMLSVSAPNAQPDIFPGVKPGNDRVSLTLSEGNGRVLTEEEARTALNASTTTTGGSSGELSAEQKKAQADYEKQVADITAKNAKAAQTDELIKKLLNEANQAFQDKNYDLAINKFNEGIAADPDYAGTTPVLLNNKTAALLNRATQNYNQGVKSGDATAKATALESVKKDLTEAAAASNRSLEILKTATTTDANVQKNYEANRIQAISNRKEVYRLMARTGVERTKGKEAQVAFQEYFAVETDAKKKSDAQLALAEVLQESAEFDLAIAEFEKVLATSPDNVEALAGAGLSLVNVGFINNDKAKLQQGANYLQKFSDLAPETHKYKADAKSLLDNLKKDQNVAPVKSTKKKS